MEEVEGLGQSQQIALKRQLRRLLLHMLQARFQPEKHGMSWEISMADTRDKIGDLLESSPSLLRFLKADLGREYLKARKRAALQTGLESAAFPLDCPFTWEEILDDLAHRL